MRGPALSLRGAKRRSNPEGAPHSSGSLRCARDDAGVKNWGRAVIGGAALAAAIFCLPVTAAFSQTPPAASGDPSAVSVRFFGDTCLKYVTAPGDLVKFLDGTFTRQDAAHGAAFRRAANATDDAAVWLADLPEGNFAVIWDPGHNACHLIGQPVLDSAKVRVEFNKMMADLNASGKLEAKLVPMPTRPGDFSEAIEIDGLPGHMIGIVASVNTAPKATEAGSRYTLFVRRLPPAPQKGTP